MQLKTIGTGDAQRSVGAPSLEVFKAMDVALDNLNWWEATSPGQRLALGDLEVPSNLSHSFYDL